MKNKIEDILGYIIITFAYLLTKTIGYKRVKKIGKYLIEKTDKPVI